MELGKEAEKTIMWLLGIVLVLAIIIACLPMLLGYLGNLGTAQTYTITLNNGTSVTQATPSILSTIFSPTTGLGVLIVAFVILIVVITLLFKKKGK